MGFAGSQIGWAVGSQGVIMRTADGGLLELNCFMKRRQACLTLALLAVLATARAEPRRIPSLEGRGTITAPREAPKDTDLLFVGNMGYPPNVLAAILEANLAAKNAMRARAASTVTRT